MDRFQPFLDELAKVYRFNSLSPDSMGACLISLHENQTSLLFEFDTQLVPNTILISSIVISLPFENRVEILEQCLKGNQLQEETLSCKPDEDLIYLHRRLHPDIQAKELEPILSSFANQILSWRNKIQKMATESPKSHRFPLPPPTFQIPPLKA